MTLEQAIQTLQANAELLHFEYPHLGIKEAIGVAIEALSQPSLPSNLDEAAKQFQGRWDNDQSPEASFKAGAQWRDAQIPKLPDSIDEAAKDILAGMLSNPGTITMEGNQLKTIEGFVDAAIQLSDELIKQLETKRRRDATDCL